MSLINYLTINIVLAGVWAALAGQFSPQNLLAGFVLGYLMLWLSRRALGPTNYFTKVPQFISFLFFFLYELVRANLRVAREVLTPRNTMRPGIVAVPLDLTSNLQITVLANLITLTPGTLSLDVSDDRQVIYVHAMFIDEPDQFRRDIKRGFERRVRELFT
jgi:multicomponent Na+:H+ antiporter subunit E